MGGVKAAGAAAWQWSRLPWGPRSLALAGLGTTLRDICLLARSDEPEMRRHLFHVEHGEGMCGPVSRSIAPVLVPRETRGGEGSGSPGDLAGDGPRSTWNRGWGPLRAGWTVDAGMGVESGPVLCGSPVAGRGADKRGLLPPGTEGAGRKARRHLFHVEQGEGVHGALSGAPTLVPVPGGTTGPWQRTNGGYSAPGTGR